MKVCLLSIHRSSGLSSYKDTHLASIGGETDIRHIHPGTVCVHDIFFLLLHTNMFKIRQMISIRFSSFDSVCDYISF